MPTAFAARSARICSKAAAYPPGAAAASSATDSRRTISWVRPPESRGHFGEIGYPAAESGVNQPVGHPRGRKEPAGQLVLTEFAASIPVRVRVGVARQTEHWCTVRAHREADLGVE